jgi:hypothetical protein
LAQYSDSVKELHEGSCTSEIRVETPFLQVANNASKILNYASQDAVKDFEAKPLNFPIFLNICYTREAPARQIDSSTLSIQIDAPDDQHVTT